MMTSALDHCVRVCVCVRACVRACVEEHRHVADNHSVRVYSNSKDLTEALEKNYIFSLLKVGEGGREPCSGGNPRVPPSICFTALTSEQVTTALGVEV